MGAVEDLRKVLQDVVTPDLKAQEASLGALEKRVDLLDRKVDSLKVDLEEN